jgi:hypothetical protein
LEAKERLQQAKGAWLGRGESREQAKQKLLRYARQPKTEAHRAAISRANVVATATGGKGKLTRPFHLCLLCGLVIHRRGWHRICWDTWRAWYRQHIGSCRVPPKGARPSPLQEHGPKPETNLARNYRWLLKRRSGGACGYARTLLASTGEALTSKSTVNEGVKAFLARLPGSWDLVFTAPRRGNAARHALVPLPFQMIRVVGDHGRDLLIRRLIEFGMAGEEITRLTGMSLSRVKGVATGLKPEPASPPHRRPS